MTDETDKAPPPYPVRVQRTGADEVSIIIPIDRLLYIDGKFDIRASGVISLTAVVTPEEYFKTAGHPITAAQIRRFAARQSKTPGASFSRALGDRGGEQ
jgi:hypothetical protein